MSLQKIVQPPIGEVIEAERRRLNRPRVLVEVPRPVPASSHPKSSTVDVIARRTRFRVRWADLSAAVLTVVLVVLGVLAFEGQWWALWAALVVAWCGAAVLVGVAVGRVIRARDGEVAR
jgi:hypothetical protein